MPLKDKEIPLLVNGAINTKSNPKLVQPPALLELENQYQLRTGELRTRNGFSKFAQGGTSGIWTTAEGGLGAVGAATNGLTIGRFSSAGGLNINNHRYAGFSCSVTGVRERYSETGEQIESDSAIINGVRVAQWIDGGASGLSGQADFRDMPTGYAGVTGTGLASSPGRPMPIVACGSTFVAFCIDTTASPSKVIGEGFTLTAGGTFSLLWGTSNVITDLSQAQPWFDAKAIPGTSNVAIAWRANAGGVKCAILNSATGAVTSTVTTAGADATMTLGWLDDQLSTGNMYLATAGGTSGVVVRVMSAATMVVSATNTIDATALANVRNVTGHTAASATDYRVLWDIAGSSVIYDKVRIGHWTGAAATVSDLINHRTLYSRTAKHSDGNYYVLASCASTVQPGFGLYNADETSFSSLGTGRTEVAACYALMGEGGGRRNQCSLTTPTLYNGTLYMTATRRRQIQTPASPGAQSGAVYQLGFAILGKLRRARELGGTVFIPGGVVTADDGNQIRPAAFPLYPEAPSLVQSVGAGALTLLGTYQYRCIFRRVDATGRVYRSAGSVQASITLTGGNNTVSVTLFNLREFPANSGADTSVYCEVYRKGPTASGATLYNKLGEVAMGTAVDTVVFADTVSDTTAASGEVAYFNGNVLENFVTPSCSLLEVNGNRVGLVNAEEPTEFWVSKELKAGVGVGFYPDFRVRITGDGAGALTALAAMDGRWILFKRSAIYVLSGDGWNDLGQGGFNAPQAVSRNIGTTNPSSVIETPDGIMFEAGNQGIWLLGRDLSVQYVGAPVEQYTIAEDVAGAAPVTGLTTVRFVMPSGRCLEWDYHHKRWYTHQLRVDRSGVASTVVDCVNTSLSGWCYMLANADIMQEVAGQTTDVNGTTTAIIPRIGFPVLQLSGLAGYQRFRSVDFTLDVIGNCTLSVDAEYNYSGALTGTPKTIALTTATPTAQVTYTPPEGRAKCTAVRLVLTVQGNPANGTFRLTGANAYVAVKRGSNVVASNRMT